MAKDIDMIKMRMTALDSHFATLLTSLAGQNDRIDRLEERMKRVERRLELRDDS